MFKQSKNWHFSKRVNPWFWSTNCHFSNFFFGNIGQENVFYDILVKKTPFKSIKTRILKSRKIDIFSKGLTHGFGPKKAIFPTFFFGNIGHENVFYDIQEGKNVFLGYKTSNSKGRKIHIFSKGLPHAFGPKMAIFQKTSFFLRQYRPGKCLSRYSRTKKHLYRL